MTSFYLYLLFIINITIIYAYDKIVEKDYLYKLIKIKEVSKSNSCKLLLDDYLNCFIDYHVDDSIPDYNKDCDNYMSDFCKTVIENTTAISNCENKYHIKLFDSIENAYEISNLYCFRGKNQEFCPISKIFQKAKTIKKEITGEDFSKFSLLHEYCIDDSCAQYFDQSYVGIYALKKIGILKADNIMLNLRILSDFMVSPDCIQIKNNYEDSEIESYSGKKYLFSKNIIFFMLLTSFIFLSI